MSVTSNDIQLAKDKEMCHLVRIKRCVWGRRDPGMCVAQSLHCSPETITSLLTGYIPIQTKSFFVLKKGKKYINGT